MSTESSAFFFITVPPEIYTVNDIFAVFLPVNGVGNNMNMVDAKAFCERINPEYAVPLHCQLFDNLDMNEFDYKDKVVPKMYEEIKFN